MHEKETFVTGGPTAEFLSDDDLDHTSLPHEWFEPFAPRSLTSLWTKYTNTKALMENAGNIGEIYPDFYPFTPDEMRKHLGVYIVHGLAPSPEVSMKFKNQSEDDINGNDFVNRSLGPQAVRRHKHFRRFFATQNPLLRPPSSKDSPNWKIDSFLKWIIKISTKAWRLSQKVSVDEQTTGFQGRHVSKLRITYKKEGDGFQYDALCDDGYTFMFYFRHEPPPAKYTSMGLSPLHARVMSLFDKVTDEYHECGVDNLYMSAKFCRDAYNHPKKVRLHGVTRKSGRGLPSSVLQQEVQNKAEQDKVRGTVLAAELVGDSKCPSLVAVSVYDTKPVHFLSMKAQSIKWEEKSRQVYDRSKGEMTTMKFLRLNVNDDYNYGMGGADIADQLRGSYRFDHWLRNFKWWHSIFWWGFQVLMVNAYKCYCRYHEEIQEVPMSHYKFQKMIAHTWMQDDYYATKKKASKTDSTTDTCSISSISTATTSTTRRSRISDSALHPISGSLKSRLNKSGDHWPASSSKHHIKKSNCQLHYWATGKRAYSNVAYCKCCKVSLCTDNCFEVFHTVWNLTEMKACMKTEMMKKTICEGI